MNSSPRSSPQGCASSSTSRCGQWQVWGGMLEDNGGGRCRMPSLAKTLTQAATSQICPVLYHAGTVLLNSLLDTVPGELCRWGGQLWAPPWHGGGEEAGWAAVR